MVNTPAPQPGGDEKPFALKSTIYTVGFLLFVLGVLPSLFYVVEEGLLTADSWTDLIQSYWIDFRRLVGGAVFALGLAAYLFCSIWLMFYGRGPHVEFDPPKHFVATGPYRWVRNTVVLTLLVTVLGEAIYYGSLGILALLLFIGLPFAQYQVTRIEEPLLRQRFGQSYIDYCTRVPRWTPRPPSPD